MVFAFAAVVVPTTNAITRKLRMCPPSHWRYYGHVRCCKISRPTRRVTRQTSIARCPRRSPRLQPVVHSEARGDCERLGVRAAAVPADVTDEVEVHHVAVIALERFGRIDVWINNAGV